MPDRIGKLVITVDLDTLFGELTDELEALEKRKSPMKLGLC
jgi:hypothetical protein